MIALSFLVLCAAPSPAEVQMSQSFAQYYDTLAGYRQQADDAAKQKDWAKARAYYGQVGNAVDGATKRVEQAKAAGAWKGELVFKTKDGTFKGEQFLAALRKLKVDCAKRLTLAEAAAKDPKQQAPPSGAELGAFAQQLARYLDALAQVDAEAKAALDAKDVVKAAGKLKQLDSSSGQLLVTLAEQKKKGVFKDAMVIEAKARKVKGSELVALLTATQASAQKRFKGIEKAYQVELEKQNAERKAAALARPQAQPGGKPRSAAAPAGQPAAAPAAAPVDYAGAATFASGRCNFGHCATDGWDNGVSSTRCNFGHCFKDGWTTTQQGGQVSETRCNFNDCLKDGWSTTHPDGTTSETRCNFNNCATDGWSTSHPDGTVSETRCSFNACFTDGWSTTLPNGNAVECRCSFNNCLTDGVECG